jgi:crotonobetainyl-CoA:carnitine CoA-transferase CaiB-like acyl-CoA transferase
MATMTLSDQGAEVVKVEPPGGDPFRSYGGYTVWNRGKKSVVLDLKNPSDKVAFLMLASSADVLIESFSPGTMARLGLDYETLRRQFPALVYCSITGYPRNSTHANRPGIDALVQARSGQQFEQAGWRDGPVFLFHPMPSLAASYLAAAGITAALYVRELTSKGQWVETSLYQGVLAFTTQLWQWAEKMDNWMSIQKAAQPAIFQCADGAWVHSMQMAGGRGRDRSVQWRILGMEPQEGNLFQAPPGSPQDVMLRDAFRKIPRKELVEKFWAAEIPIGPIQYIQDAFTDPQVTHNKAIADVVDPVAGPTKQVGITINLHAAPAKVQSPAPLVGEHTANLNSFTKHRPDSSKPLSLARERAKEGGQKLRHALEGVRVLDFGNFLAGPFGPMVLADLGAEVIKLESIEGDQMRHATMPFNGCQRGKRDIAVDLKRPEGVEIARRLMRTVDVVHHNFRPGVAERLGIDYSVAKALRPDVIYCHTPAYGITGPRAHFPGFDQVFQAMCGLEIEAGGEGNPPVWYRFGMCDTGNAFQSVIGVLMALYYRERTGKGQFVDTNLLNCGLYYNSDVYIGPNGPFKRHKLDKNQTGFGPLYRLYQAKDGWVAIACMNDGQWRALCTAIGRPNLANDERFATPEARRDHADQLTALLEGWFSGAIAKEVFALLDGAGVPCEIADPNAGRELLMDPANIASGLAVEYVHATYGKMRENGHMINFSETPGRIELAPPLIGQHTQEIMAALGYTRDEMAALKASKVITWPPLSS